MGCPLSRPRVDPGLEEEEEGEETIEMDEPRDPSLSVVGIRVEPTVDPICREEEDSSPDREAVNRLSPSLPSPPKAVRFNLNRVSPADADPPLLQTPDKEPPPKFRSPEVMPATSTTESGPYLPVKQLKEYRRKCDLEESTGTSHGGADDSDQCLADVSEGKSGVLFETINEEEEVDHPEGIAEDGIDHVEAPPSLAYESENLTYEDHVDGSNRCSEGCGRRPNETVTLAEIHHHRDYQGEGGEDRAGLGGLSEGDLRMGQSEGEARDLAEKSVSDGAPEARDASASPFGAERPVESGERPVESGIWFIPVDLASLESSGVTRKEPMLNPDTDAKTDLEPIRTSRKRSFAEMGDVNNSAGSELKRVVAANFQGAGDDGRNGFSLSRDGTSSYVDRENAPRKGKVPTPVTQELRDFSEALVEELIGQAVLLM